MLVYDPLQIEENYLTFLEAKKDVAVHYSIKACPEPRVLQRIASLGGGFDVASRAEVDLAIETGVSPSKCIYSNTVKFPADIRDAFEKGVVSFIADAEHEVRKLAQYAPGSKLYIRLLVESKEAAHPLGEKFGTTVEIAKRLLKLGAHLGLEPYGTHFHVGTQCYSTRHGDLRSTGRQDNFRDLSHEGIELRRFRYRRRLSRSLFGKTYSDGQGDSGHGRSRPRARISRAAPRGRSRALGEES